SFRASILTRSSNPTEAQRMFWTAVWLAVALVAIKASYLGVPDGTITDSIQDYVRSVAAISYRDVLLTATLWASVRVVLSLAGSRGVLSRLASAAFVAIAASVCAYNLANVILFDA